MSNQESSIPLSQQLLDPVNAIVPPAMPFGLDPSDAVAVQTPRSDVDDWENSMRWRAVEEECQVGPATCAEGGEELKCAR